MSYVEDCGDFTQLQPKKYGAMITCTCGKAECKGQVVINWTDTPDLILYLLDWAQHYGAIAGVSKLEMVLPSDADGDKQPHAGGGDGDVSHE